MKGPFELFMFGFFCFSTLSASVCFVNITGVLERRWPREEDLVPRPKLESYAVFGVWLLSSTVGAIFALGALWV